MNIYPIRKRVSAKSRLKQERRAPVKEGLRLVSIIERDATNKAYRHEEQTVLSGTRDSHHSWEVMSTSEAKVSKTLKFNLRKWTASRLRQTGRPVSILDMGCYDAVALQDLKTEFGSKVRVVGSTIQKEPFAPYENVDRVVEGDVLRQNFREKFDLIFSHRGAVFHSPTPQAVIKKAISMLKPNGVAVLETMWDKSGRMWEINAVIEMCKSEGARVTIRSNHVNDVIFLIRKLPQKSKLPA
jgi:SAM-dependent methyltransferase